jgi:transcriptional regulator with XRE-family HTH domain
MGRTYSIISGEEIRQRREAYGWPQSELAEKMGVNKGTVSRWELGTARPAFRTSCQLAILLGLDVRLRKGAGAVEHMRERMSAPPKPELPKLGLKPAAIAWPPSLHEPSPIEEAARWMAFDKAAVQGGGRQTPYWGDWRYRAGVWRG